MAWTPPSTRTAGEVLTAATWNEQVRDNMKAIGDPWTAYTPTWTATTTNPTLGNGTRTAAYMQAGKLVHFRIEVLFGSTTTAGAGAYELTLPVAAAATNYPAGHVVARTSGGTRYGGLVWPQTTTLLRGLMFTTDTLLSHAVPVAWASGDRFNITGTYEAA
jgi:hypothetical protein